MPIPARNTGVSPILGLITEPVKGPIGVCYIFGRVINTRMLSGTLVWIGAYPAERLFFEVPASFYTQDQTDIMDALNRHLL